jgi:carbon storage regulator
LNEAVVIGDGIEIVVLRHGRDGVRLGIKAPSHVPVHRREIYDTIKAANASAAARSARSEELVERLRQRIEQW